MFKCDKINLSCRISTWQIYYVVVLVLILKYKDRKKKTVVYLNFVHDHKSHRFCYQREFHLAKMSEEGQWRTLHVCGCCWVLARIALSCTGHFSCTGHRERLPYLKIYNKTHLLELNMYFNIIRNIHITWLLIHLFRTVNMNYSGINFMLLYHFLVELYVYGNSHKYISVTQNWSTWYQVWKLEVVDVFPSDQMTLK